MIGIILISNSNRHYLPLSLKFNIDVGSGKLDGRTKLSELFVDIAPETCIGIEPLDRPLHPKVSSSILLYTYADGTPDNMRFIAPLLGTGVPETNSRKVAFMGVPGNKSPVTYST
jgi:hypothetical protein